MLSLILADVADHVDYALDQLAQVGVLPLDRTDAGKIQQFFRYLFAAESLGLNHPQIIGYNGMLFVARI